MVTVGTMVAVRDSLNILSICTGPAPELYLLTEKVYAYQWDVYDKDGKISIYLNNF